MDLTRHGPGTPSQVEDTAANATSTMESLDPDIAHPMLAGTPSRLGW
jgi:hypothetical protein